MFVSTAYAQAAGEAASYGSFGFFLPLVLIFVVFYFLLIRPQQKQAKQRKAMLEAIRRGDKIITGGGIIGTVAKVIDDNELDVNIGKDMRIRVVRQTVAEVLSRTAPADSSSKGGEN